MLDSHTDVWRLQSPTFRNVTSAPAKSRFAGSEQYCFGAALSIRTGCRLTRLEYKTLNGTQWAYPLRE